MAVPADHKTQETLQLPFQINPDVVFNGRVNSIAITVLVPIAVMTITIVAVSVAAIPVSRECM
jgi:hypothetical protein